MTNEKDAPKPKATDKMGSKTKSARQASATQSAPPAGKADHLESYQWKPGGPSPYPKGRPRGRKNNKTLVREAFLVPAVMLPVNGKQKKLSKKEVAYHQVGNKAAQGDLKAFDRMNDLLDRHGDPEDIDPTDEEHALNLDIVAHYDRLFKKFSWGEAGHE